MFRFSWIIAKEDPFGSVEEAVGDLRRRDRHHHD